MAGGSAGGAVAGGSAGGAVAGGSAGGAVAGGSAGGAVAGGSAGGAVAGGSAGGAMAGGSAGGAVAGGSAGGSAGGMPVTLQFVFLFAGIGGEDSGRQVSPAWNSNTFVYSATVAAWDTRFDLGVYARSAAHTVSVNGTPLMLNSAGQGFRVINITSAQTVFTIGVSDGSSTSTYTITVNRPEPVYVKPTFPDASDAFGTAVAVSREGSTMALGAPGDDSPMPGSSLNTLSGSGTVLIFTRVAGAWVFEQALKSNTPAASEAFGSSVSLDETGNWLAVGAPGDSVGGANSGAVHVFERSMGSWVHRAKLKANTVGASDGFGASIALTSANRLTLVVGAPGEDATSTGGPTTNGSADSGAVYVFTADLAPPTTWTQAAFLKGSAPAGGRLGTSVAVGGMGTLAAAGAPGAGGRVETFSTDGVGPWAAEPLLTKPASVDPSDEFGSAVALEFDRLVVGTPGDDSGNGQPTDNSAMDSGAVWVFTRASMGWNNPRFVKPLVRPAGARFGAAVALQFRTLVVGAPLEGGTSTGFAGNAMTQGAANAGAVYVFYRFSNGADWNQNAYLKMAPLAPGQTTHPANTEFGAAVALGGNSRTLLVGAAREDSDTAGLQTTRPAFSPTQDVGAGFVW
jgi:hypothetical protein